MTAKFEIYKGKIGDFHWKLTHTNGRLIAKSGEGYTTKVNAIHGLNSVKKNVPGAAIEDRTGPRVLIISGSHKVEGGLL
ncbi:YegP family protein [Chloroflexota bacterium]